MTQQASSSPTLFEWLADHNTSLVKSDQSDSKIFNLIDQYIQLVDMIDRSAAEKPGSNEKADAELLANREREIISVILENPIRPGISIPALYAFPG